MHIAYVDDSAQRGRREGQGKLIGLGAAVLAEEHVKPFADAFYACYDKFDIPHEVELKWSPDSKTDWFRANERTDVITPLREAVLDAALKHEAKLFAAIWDDGAQKTMHGEGPGHWVVKFEADVQPRDVGHDDRGCGRETVSRPSLQPLSLDPWRPAPRPRYERHGATSCRVPLCRQRWPGSGGFLVGRAPPWRLRVGNAPLYCVCDAARWLVLPEPEDDPTFRAERLVCLTVASLVACDLRTPVVRI